MENNTIKNRLLINKVKIYIILLVIFGFILRIISAINLGVSADDVNHGVRPYGIFNSGKLVIWDQSTSLWYYIEGVFYKYFGVSLLVSRFSAVIFGSLMIILVYIFTKRLFKSERPAIIASTLIAFSPMLIKSTLPEMDIATSFFALFSAYFILLYFESKSNINLFFSAIMIGIATMIKLYALFFAFSFLLLLLYKELVNNTYDKKIIKKFILFIFILLILVLPTLIHNFLLYKNNGFMDLIFTNVLGLGVEKSKQFYSWGAGWMAYTDYKGFFLGNQRNFGDNDLPGFLIVLNFLFKGDPILFIFGILGLILFFIRRKDYSLFFIITFLPAFIYLGAQIPMSKHFIWVLVFISPCSGFVLDEIINKTKKIKLNYILVIIILFNLVFLGMAKDVVHSHFYGESSFGKLLDYKQKNIPKEAVIIVDNRIYSGNMHFGFIGTNYVDAITYATELDQKLTKNNLEVVDVYFVECVIDDCGWGTIEKNPLVNNTMEQIVAVFNQTAVLKKDFFGPNQKKFYLPFNLYGEEILEYRIYKTQLLLNPTIKAIIREKHQWYLYPIGYDRSISTIFDDYELKNNLDKILNSLGFFILYLELILSYATILYILYFFVKE